MSQGKADRRGAIAAALLSTFSSSLAWIFEREAAMLLGPITVMALAPLAGGALILALASARRELESPRVLLAHLRDVVPLFLFRYVIGLALVVLSLTYTTASKAMFLTKMEPYAVILIGWLFFAERIAGAHLLLLLVHIAGAMLLSTGGNFEWSTELTGDILIGVGIVLLAASYFPAQRLAKACNPSTSAGYLSVLSGALFLPAAIVLEPSIKAPFSVGWHGWAHLGATIVLFHVLSLLLWYYALRGLPSWLVSASRCLGPVLAAPVAWIVFDQRLNGIQIFGAAVVIVTSLLMLRERK